MSLGLLRGRLRSIGWKPLALGCLLLATALVVIALPSRRTGERSATDAFLPLRQPTGPEAVELMRQGADEEHPQSAILGEEGRDLLIATRLYAVPVERADESHGEWLDDGESRYRISSATWDAYYSLYRVDRVAYERALGRRLEASDFSRPPFVDEYTLSFDPADLPEYLAIEIGFLAAWFLLLAKALLAVRRPTAVLPVLVPLLLAPAFFVAFYSPAFADADWFFQRIVVEQVALFGLGAGLLLLLPALASAAVYVLLRAAECLAERRDASASTYRIRTLAGIGLLCLLFVVVQLLRYRAEAAACLEDRRIVRARVAKGGWVEALLGASSGDLPRATNLMKAGAVSDEVRREVERVLAPAGERTDPAIVVLTPATAKAGEHLFLWRNGFLYADFRELQDEFGSLIDSQHLVEVQRAGEYSTGFGPWLAGGRHLCGETLEVEGHSVLVAVKQPRSSGLWAFR